MDISVIIPIYNAEKYIIECLNSVKNQKNIDLEIICIDDDSTDNSGELIKNMSQNDNKIKYIKLAENHGQAYARNEGLKIAKGKYIYFLDSDDTLKGNGALKEIFDVAEKKQTEGILFESEIVYESDELKPQLGNRKTISEGLNTSTVDGKSFFCAFMKAQWFSVAVWRQLWNRDYLINNNIWFNENTSPHEDLLFTFEAIIKCKKISYYPKILHIYKFRKNSASSGRFTVKRYFSYIKMLSECMNIIKSLIKTDLPFELDKYFRRFIELIINPVYEHYCDLISDGNDIWNNSPVWINGWEKYLGHLVLQRRFPMLERVFKPNEYYQLKKASTVLVYGNGKYANDIRIMLQDFNINSYEIVVTKKEANSEVKELSEFVPKAKEAVVLLAVSGRYKEEMLKYAKSNGFISIIDLQGE